MCDRRATVPGGMRDCRRPGPLLPSSRSRRDSGASSGASAPHQPAQPLGGARARASAPCGCRHRGGRGRGALGRASADQRRCNDRCPGGRPLRRRPYVDREGRRLPARQDRAAALHLVPGTAPHAGAGRPRPASLRARPAGAQRRPPPPRGRAAPRTEWTECAEQVARTERGGAQGAHSRPLAPSRAPPACRGPYAPPPVRHPAAPPRSAAPSTRPRLGAALARLAAPPVERLLSRPELPAARALSARGLPPAPSTASCVRCSRPCSATPA